MQKKFINNFENIMSNITANFSVLYHWKIHMYPYDWTTSYTDIRFTIVYLKYYIYIPTTCSMLKYPDCYEKLAVSQGRRSRSIIHKLEALPCRVLYIGNVSCYVTLLRMYTPLDSTNGTPTLLLWALSCMQSWVFLFYWRYFKNTIIP